MYPRLCPSETLEWYADAIGRGVNSRLRAAVSNKKSALRHEVWGILESTGVARPPGAFGRIPNFVGADDAARRLAELPEWKRATVVEINPDTPQFSVRKQALREGKLLYMAVPRLETSTPFLELNPAYLRSADIEFASTIDGALYLGWFRTPGQLRPIDLVVVGSVAVSCDGARLGKGRGYSDLGYGILRAVGRVGASTPVVTTVHPYQVIEPGRIAMTHHDVAVDLIVLPDRVIRGHRRFERPHGLDPQSVAPEQIEAIPVLGPLMATERELRW